MTAVWMLCRHHVAAVWTLCGCCVDAVWKPHGYRVAAVWTPCGPLLQDGTAPLWIASQMGHSEVVRVMLLRGAEWDATRDVSLSDSCVAWAQGNAWRVGGARG